MKILTKFHLPNWLTLLLVFAFILRIPSFFEPYSYGDETIYLTLGEGIRQGIPLYKGLHDNKPPALYILAAAAGNLFWFKAILAFWNLATIVLFWKLSVALFPRNEKLQKVATLIFSILTCIPLFEGNIANAELFMVGPTILAFLILFTKKITPKNLFCSGALFSLATLFKVPAAFDFFAIVFFWVIVYGIKKTLSADFVRNSFFLAVGFIIPIGITFVWFLLAGSLKEYVSAAFLQNVGYLSSWRPSDVREPFLIRNLPLLTRAGVVGLGLLILYLAQKKLSRQFIFITIWLLFSLFAITLSERPYPHYFIQAVPQVSILLAVLFTQKNLEQSLVIIPLALAFFVPLYFKFWYYPTMPYYQKFIRFATGQMTKASYFSTFGGEVNRNYEIANFITNSAQKGEKVFVWEDSSQIYALSRHLPPGKYVASYHIKDFSSKESLVQLLDFAKPSFIIILPGSEDFRELAPLLRKSYIPLSLYTDTQVWSLVR